MQTRLARPILSTAMLLFSLCFLMGFAWKVKPNAQLRSELVTKMGEFADKFKNDPLAKKAKEITQKEASNKDEYAWIPATYEFVSQGLKACPPEEKNKPVREAILRILDYPLHSDDQAKDADPKLVNAWTDATEKFYDDAMEQAIREIKSTKVDKGLVIWKMYNMGFVVKSKKFTIGFDIISGPPLSKNGARSSKTLSGIGELLDVLFISHVHGDHSNVMLVNEMTKAGKKVVVPLEYTKLPFLMGKSDAAKKTGSENQIGLFDNKDVTEVSGLKVRSYPGHQDKLQNCVYVVSFDGFTVSHNGDNCDGAIYSELAKAGKIDVLLANCWSGFGNYAAAAKPAMMITGHENELGHSVSHRESFMETYGYMGDGKNLPKTFILNWGETISYPDMKSIRQPVEPTAPAAPITTERKTPKT